MSQESRTALPANLLQRLKEATAVVHGRVEERLDLFSPDFDLSQYVELLQRFYGFWEPVEATLQRFPELWDPALALKQRFKAHLLEADLRAFGIDAALVSRCTQLPCIGTPGQALGCMYVLEGSTLGSRIIARHLAERFHLDSGPGAAFFHAYGAATGQRWGEFREFLIAGTHASAADEILEAAVETFVCFDNWLAYTAARSETDRQR